MRQAFPAWLLLLGGLTAIAPLSIDMYLPAFLVIAEGLGTQRAAVERTLPVFLAGLALAQLVYGPLSDRYGRRPPLFAGLMIYVIGSTGCAVAADIDGLTVWRLVQALGGGVGLVVARAVIRDRFNPHTSARAISKLMLVMGLAPILAPLAGGWMLALGSWRGIFVVQAAFGAILLVWAWRAMAETRPAHAVQSIRVSKVLRTYARLLADRHLMLPAASGAFAMAGMFAYIAGSPFVMIGLYGVDERSYGLLFGLNAFGLIAASQLNGRWLSRQAPLDVLRRTLWLPAAAGVALLAMALAGTPPLALLVAGLFAYIASLGAISPNTGAIAMAGQGRAAGAASAMLGTLTYAAGMVAGLALGLFETAGVLPLAAVMAGCGVLSALCGWPVLQWREPAVALAEVIPEPPA